MKDIILYLTFISVVFSSCKTDFELNAPYKETVVVYGLLNSADDSAQYIRISKGFLGEGNALIMAQQADSINFADVMDVKLEEVNNGSTVNTFILERVDSIPKDEGIFAYPYQVYYRLTRQKLNSESFYRLVIRNRETDHVATSLTRIVKDLTSNDIENPSNNLSTVNFADHNPTNVKFYPVANANVYDVVIRFHYTENDAGLITYHYVDLNFPDQFITSGAAILFPFNRSDLYKLLGTSIPVKSGVIRTPGNPTVGDSAIEYRIMAGTEDLNTYLKLNSPANTSIQDPPLFTTIENGVGLFTSRLIHIERKILTQKSLDSLKYGQFTKNLSF